MSYLAIPIATRYWKPGDDYVTHILKALEGRARNGDFVVISEKALAVASGLLIDESRIKPTYLARFLAGFWMRTVWGCILGRICRFRRKTIRRLRAYPSREGSAHKQVALRYAGFFQSLLHYSEGGIDVSNLPYSYASLPLPRPQDIAEKIRNAIRESLLCDVTVLISDTDRTFSIGTMHFAARPVSMPGIRSLGLAGLLIGRVLGLRRTATPLASAGSQLRIEEALVISNIAEQARGFGAGRTAWDMARRFGVKLTDVTWEMLDTVRHVPIVIIRKRYTNA